MTHANWIVKLVAAAMIPAAIGMGSAFSAASPTPGASDHVSDEAFRPGADGIDYASVTGPQGPSVPGQRPACADPARTDLRPCVK